MTNLELSYNSRNDIYDPDDIGLQNSPLLEPLNPRLQPTPSPPPEELEFNDTKPLPSQGDAVLIGFLGGGKALEVARRAGRENLAADEEESSTYRISDYAYDIGHLPTDAHDGFHATASTNQSVLCLDQASIAAQQGHFILTADATTANEIGDKTRTSTLISPSSMGPTDFQVEQTPNTINWASRANLPPKVYSTFTGIGGFRCTHAGCTAKPFQTQYLLKSHTNVHSSNRPFYCPVKDCARGEGGKGFKRKNEMIRHGLVHESPGYACPYCADNGRRYPRPDNLQRHVYSQHGDKSKDDTQLKEILAQRPEGLSRGRWRSK